MTEEPSQVGAYRLEGLLGRGGMATVYKAWHTGLHRYEALKLLPPALALDRDFVERFLSEARLAARLTHPHIATIYTVSEPDAAQPFFTMELVEGADLAHLLAKRGCLPLVEAVPIVQQMAAALDYAHAHGIVHRDVKPGNVLLTSDKNGEPAVKLVDFGIAHAQDAGASRFTKAGMIVGTPEYMSPEQGESRSDIDYRTDIYSLGIVTYAMLCGRPPFTGDNRSAVNVIISHLREPPQPPAARAPDLPPAANGAILTALAKSPADRYPSCTAFAQALAAALPKPAPLVPELPVVVPVPPRPRFPLAAILIPLCIVLAAGSIFAGWSWWTAAGVQAKQLAASRRQAEIRARSAHEANEAQKLVNQAVIEIETLKDLKSKGQLTQERFDAENKILGPELSDAIRHAKLATEIDRSNRDAWLQLARSHYHAGNYAEAMIVIKQSAEIAPLDEGLLQIKTLAERQLHNVRKK